MKYDVQYKATLILVSSNSVELVLIFFDAWVSIENDVGRPEMKLE